MGLKVGMGGDAVPRGVGGIFFSLFYIAAVLVILSVFLSVHMSKPFKGGCKGRAKKYCF